MNQPSDESKIREVLQRVKQDDEAHVPAFDDVLKRVTPRRRSARRLQIATVCCAVAAIVLIAFILRTRQNGGSTEPKQQVAQQDSLKAPERVVSEVDFDYLQRLVDEHFQSYETNTTASMPVWSSGTETLLALNLESAPAMRSEK